MADQRQHRIATLVEGWVQTAMTGAETLVTQLATDSREVTPGCLFLACQGHHEHGLKYVETAVQRGAVAVLWEPANGLTPPQLNIPVIAVPHLHLRVGEIAARFYGNPTSQLFVAGVTGTDGKTSTAWLVSQALQRLGLRCGYIGTLGYGVPDALSPATHTTPEGIALQRILAQMRADGLTHVMMEVSSHALDQARVGGVAFDVAVLTNVTRDHLDYHGDVIHYAAAKRKLFTMPNLAAAILNQDDPCGGEWLRGLASGVRRVAYGLGGPVHPAANRHVLADEPELSMAGLQFTIRSGTTSHSSQHRFHSRLLGRFNAYNLMAALAVLQEAGIETEVALQALAEVPPVPGRMQAIHQAGKPLAVVDYAHTPEALTNALEAVRAHVSGRIICVFGCGGDRDRGKRSLMAQAVAKLADAAVVTDDNPRTENPANILKDITAAFPVGYSHQVIPDRAVAIANAIAEARQEDAVLIAGKGHESYQIYGTERRDFSDVAVAQQCLQGDRHAAA